RLNIAAKPIIPHTRGLSWLDTRGGFGLREMGPVLKTTVMEARNERVLTCGPMYPNMKKPTKLRSNFPMVNRLVSSVRITKAPWTSTLNGCGIMEWMGYSCNVFSAMRGLRIGIMPQQRF